MRTRISRRVQLVSLLLGVLFLAAGCAHEYPTPYKLHGSRGLAPTSQLDARQQLAVVAISLDAQHWQIQKVNVSARTVTASYRETTAAVKLEEDGGVIFYTVAPDGKLLDSSVMPARYIQSFIRAKDKFEMYSPEQIEDQLRRRYIQM